MSSNIQEYSAFYLAGIDAYNVSKHISENPFPIGTQENALWNTGYMDALNKVWVNKNIENENGD